jgi:hypothetical protein
MKTFFVLAVILMGGLIYLQQSLQDGTVLHYIDGHPMERGVPKATYYIGQTYFLFQDLPQAATYFLRVAERYPTFPMADDAYFNYMQSLDDNVSIPKGDLIEGYKTYLEKFPEGRHTDVVKDRLSTYSSGGVNP